MAHKATREGLKEHNRRLILRYVYSGEATNRAALASFTGLAKPTVSDIVGDLIQEGLLVEEGLGESTESGGKRPILLRFEPTVRQIIGISIDGVRVSGVLANLDGHVVVRHYAYLNGATGDDALTITKQVINALKAQLDAPLLCIVVGTSGIISTNAKIVRVSHGLGWHEYPLAELLEKTYKTSVYVGNNTELAARAASLAQDSTVLVSDEGEIAPREDEDHEGARSLVTILVSTSVEIGIAFRGTVYHHSGDLGFLRVSQQADQPLVAFLGREAIQRRVRTLPNAEHLIKDFSYLSLQYGYSMNDSACLILYEELAKHLAQIFAWVAGLIRPDQIVLAGDIADLGMPLLKLATAKAAELLPTELLNVITFSMSKDPTLSESGTIAFALHKTLGVL